MSSDFVKVVPCAQIGDETYISSLSRVYPRIPLIAAGGVTQQNVSKFILAGAIALGVGRGLIPDEVESHIPHCDCLQAAERSKPESHKLNEFHGVLDALNPADSAMATGFS
jgi:2-keto-3-deoxy-6-phosphogluconate aldolase